MAFLWGNVGYFNVEFYFLYAYYTYFIVQYTYNSPFIATQLNSTQLNSTAWTTVDSVCRSWRHKQKHDWLGCTLFNWVRSVKLSWVELCRYKHPLIRTVELVCSVYYSVKKLLRNNYESTAVYSEDGLLCMTEGCVMRCRTNVSWCWRRTAYRGRVNAL